MFLTYALLFCVFELYLLFATTQMKLLHHLYDMIPVN